MGLWGRLTNAWRAGWLAFNGKALVPSQDNSTWANFDSRMFRYVHADAYYQNTVYTNLVTYAAAHKFQGGLYKHTRGIYNPTKRLVETYVSKVYGGNLDLKDMSGGAIPIVAEDRLLKDAIRQLWKWSNWQTQKSLFVRYGATYGDAPIKIVDDRAAQKVRLEVVHPARIKEADFDDVGNVKRVVIEYVRTDESFTTPTSYTRESKSYTYTEIIDAEQFATFKDGEPFAYYEDANGNLVQSWANEYGFVPMVIGKHNDTGMEWGANCIAGSLRKIDEINDAASLLNDQVRKAVNVLWYYAGVASEDELEASATDKDKTPAVYGPAGSQPYPMIAPIAIESALANIKSMEDELERDMPELSLHRLREAGDLTAPGVSAAYSDASDRIVEARGLYDDALIRAHMMGVSIGGHNGYDDFEPFGLESYAAGDLQHYIAERPVIKIGMSKEFKIDKLIATNAPNSAVWAELDVSDDDIKKWEAQKLIALQNAPPMIDQPIDTPVGQLPAGEQPPQLTDGQSPATTGNTPAVRGNKLSPEQASRVAPITEDELAAVAAMHRRQAAK